MIVCTISGESPRDLEVQFQDLPRFADAMEEWAMLWLRARGVFVSKFSPAETPVDFCARVGISKMTFVRKTRDDRAKGLYRARWGSGDGPRTRILRIESTPLFDRFCLDSTALDNIKP